MKILVAADISPTAIAISEYLHNLLRPMQNPTIQVTILHITEPELAYSEKHPDTHDEPHPIASEQELRKIFQPLAAICQLDYLTTDGKFSEMVLKHSEDATMIVMGRRRRSRLEEMVLGSHSQFVLHRVHCPILIVPEPTPQEIARKVLQTGLSST